ncbi:nucleotide sugar dehydrogenase [Thiomicrorhabdus indica]|uniref:nucleotide sugar dehydrogenase n=1 Tax=Thiomicrorhabdus indica TaxID=2267253 RepID=UPI00102E06B8|nr:nucleotide sugar dehydrogenase [Thiomicrorhabdus indica]
MQINVFGSTISALVTAGCLAETGNQVTLIGNIPESIAEPNLSKLLKKQLKAGFLKVSEQFNQEANFHFISLPSGACQDAVVIAEQLSEKAQKDSYLVLRSNFGFPLSHQVIDTAKLPFIVNPDFAADGNAINAFTRPDRIIIGSEDEHATEDFKRLMSPFNRNRDVSIVMSPDSAILTKYATNVLIATRISLMNELALVAEEMGADIEQVRQGLGSDQRIGFSYLYPGVGFGGEHLEMDLERVQALIDKTGSQENLLRSVANINHTQKELLFRKLWKHFDCQLTNKQIALWGISYKPNSSSIKGAPSLVMIEALLHQGCQVNIYDPKLGKSFDQWCQTYLSEQQRSQLHIFDDPYNALDNSDALCVLTEWKQFWSPDFSEMQQRMKHSVIADGRNLYDPEHLKSLGFTYFGVGRK